MSRDYGDYVVDLLSAWDVVSIRSMFGGHGLYRAGLIFALIIEDVLYFKVDDSNRADYEALGCAPFTYEAKGKAIVVSYYQVSESILEDPDELVQWAQKAYEVSLRSPKKKPKKSS